MFFGFPVEIWLDSRWFSDLVSAARLWDAVHWSALCELITSRPSPYSTGILKLSAQKNEKEIPFQFDFFKKLKNKMTQKNKKTQKKLNNKNCTNEAAEIFRHSSMDHASWMAILRKIIFPECPKMRFGRIFLRIESFWIELHVLNQEKKFRIFFSNFKRKKNFFDCTGRLSSRFYDQKSFSSPL